MATITSTINRTLLNLLQHRMGKSASEAELNAKLKLLPHIEPLTKSEISEIKALWADRLSATPNLHYWRLYKSLGFYTPQLVPDDIFVKKMLRILNPLMDANVMHKKGLYGIIYNGLNQPKMLANSINGELYVDGRICRHSPSDVLGAIGGRCIIKPSVNSCGGAGVEVVDLDSIDPESLQNILRSMGSDYVCQELVNQSDDTKIFNPSSLNTFRINSLSLNGVTTVTNIMFRHGRGNTVVDNAGAGGICCGLDNDGTFLHDGIDAALHTYAQSETGITYRNHTIGSVSKIVELAIDAHQAYLPTLAHVAWDFALDNHNNPVMIEVNLGWPGIITEQLSSRRPVYNTRVDEVIEYCRDNAHRLDWRDFLGRWI